MSALGQKRTSVNSGVHKRISEIEIPGGTTISTTPLLVRCRYPADDATPSFDCHIANALMVRHQRCGFSSIDGR
jgi:hypothetical protein